jgi:predicted RNA binding protein YcfA (HicA-like mRNA interferase family)
MTGKELVKKLTQQGWVVDRIQGSHHVLKKGNLITSVPVHGSKDLKTGLLHRLLKETGLK